MLKKKICFFIAFIIACSFFRAYAATDTPSNWAAADVEKSINYNLITEKTGHDFQSNITREEYCELMIKLYEALTKDFEYSSNTNPFVDTNNPQVLKAYNLGITNGINHYEFGASNSLSREESAALLARTINIAKLNTYLYNDNPPMPMRYWDHEDISDWAVNEVEQMTAEGFIEGVDSGKFYPKHSITKEQSLTMAVRAYEALSIEYKIIRKGIIHAGGLIEGNSLTNSLEAVEKSLSEGGKVIEIDINFTNDDELVCIHDWNRNYSNDNAPLSLEEFSKIKIFNKYTTLSVDDILKIIEKNPGTYMVTDIKDNNIKALQLIAEKYPHILNRILPQAYNKAEVLKIKDMGYKNIILTFYRIPYEEVMQTSTMVKFAQDNNLFAFTFSYELAKEWYITNLQKSNILLLTHTISTKEEQDMYRSIGVHGFYTDIVISE